MMNNINSVFIGVWNPVLSTEYRRGIPVQVLVKQLIVLPAVIWYAEQMSINFNVKKTPVETRDEKSTKTEPFVRKARTLIEALWRGGVETRALNCRLELFLNARRSQEGLKFMTQIKASKQARNSPCCILFLPWGVVSRNDLAWAGHYLSVGLWDDCGSTQWTCRISITACWMNPVALSVQNMQFESPSKEWRFIFDCFHCCETTVSKYILKILWPNFTKRVGIK